MAVIQGTMPAVRLRPAGLAERVRITFAIERYYDAPSLSGH